MADLRERWDRLADRAPWLRPVGTVAGPALAILLLQIVRPLALVTSVAERAAACDLSAVSVESGAQDEVGRASSALGQALAVTRLTIHSVTQNAESLGAAARQLRDVSQQMSTNAEETSAQANVVSAASEQVTSVPQGFACSAGAPVLPDVATMAAICADGISGISVGAGPPWDRLSGTCRKPGMASEASPMV